MQRLLNSGLIALILSVQTALTAQAAETQPQQTQPQQNQLQQNQPAQTSTQPQTAPKPRAEATRPQLNQPNLVSETQTGTLEDRDRIVLERYLQRVIPSQE